MRSASRLLLSAALACSFAVFGPQASAGEFVPLDPVNDGCADDQQCAFPTAEDCATGDYNGVWDGGVGGRGSICVGAAGNIIVYTGGNANTPCGVIIVANVNTVGTAEGGDPSDWGEDPNLCA